MTQRKCNWCEATTTKALNDFSDINWTAVSFDHQPAICACPKHHEELHDLINNHFKKVMSNG